MGKKIKYLFFLALFLCGNISHIESGIFTYNDKNVEYQKTWKCPYCYQLWPVGTACQNKHCPSKYK